MLNISQLFKGILFAVFVMLSPQLRADLIDSDEEAAERTPSPTPTSNLPVASPFPEDEPDLKAGQGGEGTRQEKQGGEPSSSESSGDKETQSTVLAPTVKKQKAKKKGPNQEPVTFQSRGARALKAEGLLELAEDVVIKQGSMRLEASRAEIYYDDELKDVKRVFAEGDVKMFKTDEDTGERIQAFGDTVTFLNNERKITVDGNARLWRGKDLVRGKRIVYELDTGWIRADRVVGEVHATDPDQKPKP